MPGRRIRGDRAFKRLIKQLPDAVRVEILQLHQVTGQQQLAKEQSLVARKTGALGQGLTMRVLAASLRLKVGLVGKPVNRLLFYGWIVERGRKAQTVIVTRKDVYSRNADAIRQAGGRAGNYKVIAHKLGLSGTYPLHVRALAPRHFVYTTPMSELAGPYRIVWQRALAKAASGTSDN